jgi:glycosyltransferase involved in cell wall biosynthesis
VTSIVCLLPARNAAPELPGFLESAARFADGVVALDDGSTDETAAILEGSELVRALVREPPRPGYSGWDDARNRRRLLAEAAALEPDWVVFLDADERLDAADGAALREFLLGDALPGCAYGLRLHRTWTEDRVTAAATIVYRVFAFARGHSLPTQQFHFNPVPVEIPRSRWLVTTIRVRHLDSPERLAARRAKYAEADPRGDFADGSAPLLTPPDGDLVPWQPRPASLPVLEPDPVRAEEQPAGDGPLLACLVPARNAAAQLSSYLDSVAGLADAVVALDDGSTDETAAVLTDSALVKTVLRNPRRPGYAGWDDGANRQRLLDAAAELGARWALFLDVDERLDPEDAVALRRFLERGADPADAYGFRVHRMVGDELHYDAAGFWAYRLFAPVSGQRLPTDRLHLVPVPTSIPMERWRRTTVRIKHLASIDEASRAARAAKYAEADPDHRWQPDSTAAHTRPPGEVREWRPRPPGLPVLTDPLGAGAGAELDLEALDLEAPVLSAIVIARDDEATIERSLRSVVDQEVAEPFEVIVAVSGSDRTAAIVRERFPDVRLVELGEVALPGRARNAGLRLARGDYVSFPGSHVQLPQGSLATRIEAHRRSGCAMVTGSVRNGTLTRSGWASYFLDHGTALPGRPSGPLAGAPAHCSYERDALLEAGGFPEGMRAGEDTAVNEKLVMRGHRAYRDARIELTHTSPCRNPLRLGRHHFIRGQAYGRLLLAGRGEPRRAVAGQVLRFARGRVIDTEIRVELWGSDLLAEHARAKPLIRLAAIAACCGGLFEIGRPGGRRRKLVEGGLRGGDGAEVGGFRSVDGAVGVDLGAALPLQVGDVDGDGHHLRGPLEK